MRGREVTTTIPDDLPLVPFDPALMEQVLINLLENATKYTPDGSPIDIVARRRGKEVEVEVADRGPGVESREAERIFDKFYACEKARGGAWGSASRSAEAS